MWNMDWQSEPFSKLPSPIFPDSLPCSPPQPICPSPPPAAPGQDPLNPFSLPDSSPVFCGDSQGPVDTPAESSSLGLPLTRFVKGDPLLAVQRKKEVNIRTGIVVATPMSRGKITDLLPAGLLPPGLLMNMMSPT